MEIDYKGICNPKPKTLLLKVTSRERPQILLKTISKYISLANNTKDMVWLFSFDEDDQSVRSAEFHNSMLELIEPLGRGAECLSVTGTSSGKIDAINRDVIVFK